MPQLFENLSVAADADAAAADDDDEAAVAEDSVADVTVDVAA